MPRRARAETRSPERPIKPGVSILPGKGGYARDNPNRERTTEPRREFHMNFTRVEVSFARGFEAARGRRLSLATGLIPFSGPSSDGEPA
jgi:hypothetical protein